MTATENALATMSDKQIRQYIELNQKAGWGLEKATPAQLNMVFLLCQKYQLLPGDDVTLYEGKPWVTIDGRVKLARRHPEYRGYSCRPLSRGEKESWGYDTEDIVVECTIRTSTWGDISARGKVSRAEAEGAKVEGRRLNYVAHVHPVEMAEKRAIARAERLAFGTDALLDEEDAHLYVEERSQPERVKANARHYTEVMGTEDELQDPIGAANARRALNGAKQVVDVKTGEVLEGGENPTEDKEDREVTPGPAQEPTPAPAVADRRMARLQTLLNMAKRRGLAVPPEARITEGGIDGAIEYWEQRITNHDLDQQAAKASQA